MKITNYEKLMKELYEALNYNLFDTKVDICSWVKFREGFYVTRTYNTTICIENIYITFDETTEEIEVFDVASEDWFTSFDLKFYNKMELAMMLYRVLNRRIRRKAGE